MPNWITNRLVGKGNPERIRNFLLLIKTERQPLDFHSIIPAPEIIPHAIKKFSTIGTGWQWQEQYFIDETHRPRDLTPEEKKELDAVGYRSWGDWSFANWGTNKNAFDVELDESTVDLGYVVIVFETAWSPPVRILEHLRDMFPDIAFSCEWFTEDESFYEHHPSQSTVIARSETDRIDEYIIATLYLTQAENREFFLETQITKKTESGHPNPTSTIEPMTPERAHLWMLAPDVKLLALLCPALPKAKTETVGITAG
jgi:hypothetical protein